jgi:hypothetical protein
MGRANTEESDYIEIGNYISSQKRNFLLQERKSQEEKKLWDYLIV